MGDAILDAGRIGTSCAFRVFVSRRSRLRGVGLHGPPLDAADERHCGSAGSAPAGMDLWAMVGMSWLDEEPRAIPLAQRRGRHAAEEVEAGNRCFCTVSSTEPIDRQPLAETPSLVVPGDKRADLTRCSHTGLTIPECHCLPCLAALIHRHAPWLDLSAIHQASRLPGLAGAQAAHEAAGAD